MPYQSVRCPDVASQAAPDQSYEQQRQQELHVSQVERKQRGRSKNPNQATEEFSGRLFGAPRPVVGRVLFRPVLPALFRAVGRPSSCRYQIQVLSAFWFVIPRPSTISQQAMPLFEVLCAAMSLDSERASVANDSLNMSASVHVNATKTRTSSEHAIRALKKIASPKRVAHANAELRSHGKFAAHTATPPPQLALPAPPAPPAPAPEKPAAPVENPAWTACNSPAAQKAFRDVCAFVSLRVVSPNNSIVRAAVAITTPAPTATAIGTSIYPFLPVADRVAHLDP
jgi:hypothetical protein